MDGRDAMLELYRSEAAARTATLAAGLDRLAGQPADAAALGECAQAARQLRGAARLVKLDGAAELAGALERVFLAAQNNGLPLGPEHVQRLRPCVELLARSAEADPPDAEPEAVRAQLQALQGLHDSAAPAPPAPARPGPAAPLSGDTAMLELFRTEVDSQAAILTEGLLALESHPGSTEALAELMRAAHSVKGAARMVGVSAAVNLAHAMEDCFVAAQEGKLQLQGDDVDLLLQATDALKQAGAGEAAPTDALSEALRALLSGERTPRVTTPPAPQSAGPRTVKTAGAPAVRISAERINRLVGLAGELKVTHGWIRHYAESMQVLKRRQNELVAVIERLRTVLDADAVSDLAASLLNDAQRLADQCRRSLGERLGRLEDFDRRSANLSGRLNHEVIASRMRPFGDAVQGFPRLVRDVARGLGKQVELVIRGLDTQVDREILEKLEAPLNHLLRNAVDHGIESPQERLARGKPACGTIILEARHNAGMLAVSVSDDGRGVDLEALRRRVVEKNLVNDRMAAELSESELLDFLFLPAFSTRDQVTEISGRGVGLDVVHSVIQEMRGHVRSMTEPGEGMRVQLKLPLTLSVMRTLLVEVAGELYALPLARIDNILRVARNEIRTLEDRQFVTAADGSHIGLVDAAQVLEREGDGSGEDLLPAVVLGDRSQAYGLVVDRILGERELAVHPIDPRLGKVQDVAAAAITDEGTPLLILDVDDLLRTIDNLVTGRGLGKLRDAHGRSGPQGKRVLVVDDSLTVREVERKLLESKGYVVDVAVDGMDAWNTVRLGDYELVISDVDMPRMNGIELVATIKKDPRLRNLPVMIVSYKDRPEDRERGLEAGADYYLAKGSFHDDTLLDAVVDLIGEAH